jgi:thiol:disulfide interchange protein
MLRRLLLVLPLCLLPLLLATRGLAADRPMHVKASLVAADTSVQPGKPITVALRFVHDPHWHTYWSFPGTGLPTTIKWKLPPGWKAGDIQWPAPRVLFDSKKNIVGNGYEGELFLPVTLTAPADAKPGERVELTADVDWLMCEDICIPGNATLTLTLPISAEAPKPDATSGEKIRATVAGQPRDDAAWKITAERAAKTVTLTVTPAQPGGHVPKDLHFFSGDGLTSYELPQTVKADGKGGFRLTAPIDAGAPPGVKQLVGVLTSENGWHADGKLRGLRVAVPLAAAKADTGPLGATLFFALIGGLILNLMPCVFPVLGIKILGFVNQAGHERSKVIMHGLVFTLGVLLSFWSLAAVLAVLRAGGSELGWGFQLQEPTFVFVLAAVMLVFAMNMSGVFEFGLSATAVGSNLQMKGGYAGSFFTGVLATVVATPCSAPFLAPALGAALAVSTIESFAIFTTIAIGLSLPYLLLSIFPNAVKLLPRPGAWMETFKQFMAFPLYATVGFLFWVLAGQLKEDALTAAFGLVLIALGVWVYGRWRAPGASEGRQRFGLAGLIVCAAAGTWVGWPQPPKFAWDDWSPEAVAKLRADGRTIYVDFTAWWCATCQTNKKIVFNSSEVLDYFAKNKIATLRADWTKKDPRITAELASYGRSAVPFNVIWKPGKEAPEILPEILTPSTVLEALKKN